MTFLLSLKQTEAYFDFPENILDFKNLPPHEDFKDNPIFWEIYKKIHLDNSNQIILFNGLPRTGKSEACLDFAYSLDVDFKTGEKMFDLKDMSYTLKGYMDLIRRTEGIGRALIWEEAGLAEFGANARDFLSKDNKDASTIFQSMGFKRHLNLINLPMKTMLDKQIRNLVHWVVVTEKINSQDFCIARMYQMNISPTRDEVYHQRYNFVDSHGVVKKVSTVKIPRVPKEIRRDYKIVSDKFKQEVQEKINSRGSEWKSLPYIVSGDIDNQRLISYLDEHMVEFIEFKSKSLSVDLFTVTNGLPKELKPKVTAVFKVYNTMLKNGTKHINSETSEALARWEDGQSKIKAEKRNLLKRKQKIEDRDNSVELVNKLNAKRFAYG
jgi:hypothetical protein